MARILRALSVGAGDGRYLTIEGKEIIENCDVLYYPVSEAGKNSIALDGVKKYIGENTEICELVFPMRKTDLIDYWQSNADTIDMTLADDKIGVFITIGDIMNFSTFAYLKERLDSSIDVIYSPGVPAYNVAASMLEKNLGLGTFGFVVLPGIQNLNDFIKTLELFDTIAILKPNKETTDILELAQKQVDFKVHRVTNCGFDNTIVDYNIELENQKLPYMTVLLVEKNSKSI